MIINESTFLYEYNLSYKTLEKGKKNIHDFYQLINKRQNVGLKNVFRDVQVLKLLSLKFLVAVNNDQLHPITETKPQKSTRELTEDLFTNKPPIAYHSAQNSNLNKLNKKNLQKLNYSTKYSLFNCVQSKICFSTKLNNHIQS